MVIPHSRVLKKEHFTPQIKLRYTDEKLKEITLKQRFRLDENTDKQCASPPQELKDVQE